MVYALNPRTREDYKAGGDSSQSQSHSEIPKGSFALWTEVEVRASGWLLCFLGLQVEPQFQSLGFY